MVEQEESMTTTAKKGKQSKVAPKKPALRKGARRKPLRIRPELVPASSTYATFHDTEYLMIPVADFPKWYEDTEDEAVRSYIGDEIKRNDESPVLKTRKKHLPSTAIRVSVNKDRYIAVPVADVQEWFEDLEDLAVLRYIDENPEENEPVPLEQLLQELNGTSSGTAK